MTKEKEQIQFLRDQYKRKLTQGKLANEERKRYLENKVIVEDEYEYEETEGGESESVIGGQLNFTGNLCVPAEGGSYVVTSRYGARWGSQHYGIDLAPKVKGTRTKILSCGDGIVLDSRSGVGGFGCWIVIKHAEDLYSVYGHMKKEDLLVKTGESVTAGQHISYMGNEGQSTGVHLHFELNRNQSNRHGKGPDGKPNTFNPEDMINFSNGSATRAARAFEEEYCAHCSSNYAIDVLNEQEDLPPMHKQISVGTDTVLSDEAKELDEYLRESYTYQKLNLLNHRFEQSSLSRKKFLNTRYLALSSTKFEDLKPINKK
ncbi:MAG: M23 family metallopeptidase, partial [Bacilli bacterium]